MYFVYLSQIVVPLLHVHTLCSRCNPSVDDAPVGLSACLGAICLTGGGALLIGAYARGAKDLGRFLHDPTAEIVFVLPISLGKWRIPIGWCHRDGDRC